ncbi:uncharacterized protein [Asterias amurensis]|uniref:uncharacterized protein n=1 Tax=Asterias amurensis TaxID=7602 RepID=UPI003AB2B353
MIVLCSVAFYTQSGTAAAPCPPPYVTIGNVCYMHSPSLKNYSDAQQYCDSILEGSGLAVLETVLETDEVFKHLGLTNATTYAIGPFPPCDNHTCYFVIGRTSGAYQVGLVPCDTTLSFICEGEPFYEEPKQVGSIDLPTTTPNSVTITWERPDNVSSYRVTLEKAKSGSQSKSLYIDAEAPTEATFDRLDGGTLYRATIVSVNGPKESDPYIFDLCTIPSEIPCVQHWLHKEVLILIWTPGIGKVQQYRIEMNVTVKDDRQLLPYYTSNLEVKFDKVSVETHVKYAVFAEAVVWFQGQELRSNTYVHTIIREETASVEDKSDECGNGQDYVSKPRSAVPNDAEDITVVNIATDSLTINWTSRSNVSSFQVTAVDGEGHSPNAKKYIAADEPKEAVFDSLTGGTEYTVNVFTSNGSMDSDPVTLTVATKPMQIPWVEAEVKEKEINIFWGWNEISGIADDYYFELVDAKDKEGRPVLPVYAGNDEEIKFKDLVRDENYTIEAYAVLWSKGNRLISAPKTLTVTTPLSGDVTFKTDDAERNPTSRPTTQVMTTTAQKIFCPEINYEPTTTQVPTTTALITTTEQQTTQQTTTQDETTPQVLTTETTTLQTSQDPTTTPKTTIKLTTRNTTPQETTLKPTTRNTTPQDTTAQIVTPSSCESIFHEPPATEHTNSTLLFAQQTFDFVNLSLNFFFDQFGEGSGNPNIVTPDEITNTWECVYGTSFTTERDLKLIPDLLEVLLQGFVMGAKWAPTTQVIGHPFAGVTDVEMWRSDIPFLEGCDNYSRAHVEPSRLTFDVPDSAIDDNGTGCRSLLVVKMGKLGDLLPQDGCSDEGEFQCDEVETPYPLVTIALNPSKPPPFTEPVTVGFQMKNEVAGNIPVCVWLQTKRQASPPSLPQYSWNSSGCDTVKEEGAILCRCYHLTSFSVIIRVAEFEVDEGHKRALHVLSMLGCITTIVCACLTIAIYVYLRILKEERIIHTQFLISIALSQLIFLIGIDMIKYEVLCKVVAISLLYFFSATFSWMLVETGHLYLSVVRVFSSGSKFKLYSFVGWGLPVISVVITSAVGLSRDELISKDYCWLSIQRELIWGFAGPALLIIMVNTVMLVAVLREIGSLIERDITKMKANKYRTTAKAMIVFMPMVGLPWIFGFFALNSSLVMFDYIFTTLNGFQGLSLFMILVVGNKEVRNRLQGRIDDLNKAFGEKTKDCRDKGLASTIHLGLFYVVICSK